MRTEPLPEHYESSPEDPRVAFMAHLDFLKTAHLGSAILCFAYAMAFALTLPYLLTGVDEEGEKISLGWPSWAFYLGTAAAFLNTFSHAWAFVLLRKRYTDIPNRLKLLSYYQLAAVWGGCFYPWHITMGIMTLALLRKEYAPEWFNVKK